MTVTFSDGYQIETTSVLYSAATDLLRIRTNESIVSVAACFSEARRLSKITTDEGEAFVGFTLQAIIPETDCIRVNLTRGGYFNA